MILVIAIVLNYMVSTALLSHRDFFKQNIWGSWRYVSAYTYFVANGGTDVPDIQQCVSEKLPPKYFGEKTSFSQTL